MDINTRPYIVLNGKHSRAVLGLLISELPPITKPKMRTQIETVDGRDGDIVTPLGFSAYNKTLKIGLTYNYDIDEVIDYFNSEGQVIFSNEPDKYYRYAIYDQIDFDKLIRFKEAEVNFHVQPFKFSEAEMLKTFNFTNASSGSLVIRNNGNIYSRPTIAFYGSGIVNITLNGLQLLSLDMSSNGVIIIDSEAMNALAPSGILLNRLVTGDYDKIQLKVGNNTISFTGSVTKIEIENYSRWL